MKTDDRGGDRFATRSDLPENKAMRINDTNEANEKHERRFARSEDELRQVKLAGLRNRIRAIFGRAREDELQDATEEQLERMLASAAAPATATNTEDVPCSD